MEHVFVKNALTCMNKCVFLVLRDAYRAKALINAFNAMNNMVLNFMTEYALVLKDIMMILGYVNLVEEHVCLVKTNNIVTPVMYLLTMS